MTEMTRDDKGRLGITGITKDDYNDKARLGMTKDY